MGRMESRLPPYEADSAHLPSFVRSRYAEPPAASALVNGALREPSAPIFMPRTLEPATQYRWPFVGCCVSHPTCESSSTIPAGVSSPSSPRLAMTMPVLLSSTVTLPYPGLSAVTDWPGPDDPM
jgi:hypothetical protein